MEVFQAEHQEPFFNAIKDVLAELEAPVAWNEFQVRANLLVTTADSAFADHKSQVQNAGLVWETYLSKIWKELMPELHGPSWRKQLKVTPTPATFTRAHPSLEGELPGVPAPRVGPTVHRAVHLSLIHI